MIHDLKPYPTYKDSGVPWLGQVPTHWGVWRLGALLRERGELNADKSVRDVLSVVKDRGVIPYAEKGNVGNKKSDDITRYKVVQPGDIVLNCMNVIIGSVGLSRYTGCLSPVYYVLMPRSEGDDPRYLNAYFQVKTFQKSLIRIGNGILAHRMRIPMELLKSEPFPRPPVEEQTAIVRFLDHADRRIRRYIHAKKKLIALLNEQKRAIIHRAITRGLDPNVRLKPSGVEWLGEVPEHWEVKPLRELCSYISYGFTNPMPSADEGPYMLTANDIGEGKIRYETARRTTQYAFDHLLTKKSRPIKGDVLITKDGTLGRVAVADGALACINQSVALVRVNPGQIRPEYLSTLLRGPLYQERMVLDAGGTTIKHIYITRLAKMRISYPPLSEQEEILDTLDESLSHVARVIHGYTSEIELIHEYRTRLIADVVTGKLDVREAAARLPDEVEEPEPLDEGEAMGEDEAGGEGADLDALSEEAIA